jgi:glutathione peroxidase
MGDMKKLLTVLCLMPAAMFGASGVYDFAMNSLDGKPMPMSDFKGKVMLLVNVASRCGYTPQYEGLEALYEKYKAQGLVVIGFPANNFAQEPGTNAEIKDFCERTYHVKFPMYAKTSVKGPDKTPIYQFLTSPAANPATAGEIQWNFTKFLVDRDGKVIRRFEPEVEPQSREVVAAIEKALK